MEELTKLAIPPIGNPSIMTASSIPMSTPSSKALVATIPSKFPENASFSILRRSYKMDVRMIPALFILSHTRAANNLQGV